MSVLMIPRRGSMAGRGAAVAITDDFSDANGTNLNGKATDTGGATWVVGNGSLDTFDGKARVTAGTGSSWATVDPGTADVDMSFDLTIGAGSVDGALLRLTDGANYFRVELVPSTDVIKLIVSVAGSESLVGSTGTISGLEIGQTGTLRVLAVGTSFKVYWGGVLKIDTTSSTFQTITKHGIIGFSTNTRFDNFSLVAA